MSDPNCLIDDQLRLDSLLMALASHQSVALDTEGDGYHRYAGGLCTLQFGYGDERVVVDALADVALESLQGILGEAGPEKIIHDAAFDARMLFAHGLVLGRVFDTSVAARLLGETALGLATLLDKYFDIVVSKDQQLADWGIRPISEDSLTYLLADVAHLFPLAELLRARALDKGILPEIYLECDYLLAKACVPEEPRPIWARVKGAGTLTPMGRSIVRELAVLREELARERDLPPTRLVSNRQLVQVARSRPRNRRALKRFRGLRDLGLDRVMEALEVAVARGRVPADEELPAAVIPPSEERDARKAREKALLAWRRKEAERRDVTEHVVLPGHCARALASAAVLDEQAMAECAGFGEVRVVRYGEELIALFGATTNS